MLCSGILCEGGEFARGLVASGPIGHWREVVAGAREVVAGVTHCRKADPRSQRSLAGNERTRSTECTERSLALSPRAAATIVAADGLARPPLIWSMRVR